MRIRRRLAHPAAVALALLALAVQQAVAQEPDAKVAAKAHFDVGNARLASGDVRAALAEFQLSRALFPTRGNTLNTAIALQRLGRFDEALETYLVLPRDFELDATERERVERELELLRGLTGTLRLEVEPGRHVFIDGRDRGIAPFVEPLVLLAGSRQVRATKPAADALEKRVEISTGSELRLSLGPSDVVPSEPAAGPPPAPPPPPPSSVAAPASDAAPAPRDAPAKATAVPSARFALAFDFGVALSPGFGGPLADGCGSGCQARTALGFGARARAGYLALSTLELGLAAGYITLKGGYDGRADTLEPQGSGPQPGSAQDDLRWSATCLGVYAAWAGEARWHIRASLGAAVAFARTTDARRARYDVSPPSGGPYAADVRTSQASPGSSLLLEPELGAGLRLGPRLEVTLGVGGALLVALATPHFDGSRGVLVQNAEGRKELAYFQSPELYGGLVFALTPRLGASFRF